MSKEMAARVVTMLKEQFKKSFPEAGMRLIWPEIVKAEDKAIEGAYDYFVINNRFPSPQQLKDQVAVESKRLGLVRSDRRESEWNNQKEKRGEGPRLELSARDEHAKAAVMCIKTMYRPDKTRGEKLELFKVMDDQYPGIGWGVEGMRLKGFWEDGNPLTPPESRRQ